MKASDLTPAETAETQLAKALHTLLPTINPLDLPRLTRDRHIPRKDQAKLARALFKKLGLKGISVTTPNYSMAQSVDVSLPRRHDHVFDGRGFVIDGDAARLANSQAMDRIKSLLLAAFPNHDDRSEAPSDSYDFCWSVS